MVVKLLFRPTNFSGAIFPVQDISFFNHFGGQINLMIRVVYIEILKIKFVGKKSKGVFFKLQDAKRSFRISQRLFPPSRFTLNKAQKISRI